MDPDLRTMPIRIQEDQNVARWLVSELSLEQCKLLLELEESII